MTEKTCNSCIHFGACSKWTDFPKQCGVPVCASFAQQSEWISVSERLPEEGKNVLCYDHGKVLIAFLDDEYTGVWWDYVAYDRDDTWDEVFPTHWMPLPEAPKMKGE